MTSFLVAYGTGQGQTAKVAEHVDSVLTDRGHDVTTLPVSAATRVDVEEFDAVLVGSPVNYRRHLPEVLEFVERNREALSERPTAFFQLSIALVWAERWAREAPAALADRLAAKTGWRPDRVGFFAGAVTYTQYDRPTRWLFRAVSALTTGDADTSRDYEYTDWDAVERFAVEFAEYAESRIESSSASGVEPSRRRVAAAGLLLAGLAGTAYWLISRGDGRRAAAPAGEGDPSTETVEPIAG